MDRRRMTCGAIVVVFLLLVLCVILLVLRQCQTDEAAVTGDETEVTETEEEIEEVVDMLEAIFTEYDLGVDVVATDVYPANTGEWYVTSDAGLHQTLDGGGTWAAQDIDPGPLSTVGAYLGGSGWIVGGPDGRAFLNPDGSGWFPCAFGGTGGTRDVFSWGDHVWLVGDGIFYSWDNGTSWMPQWDFAGSARFNSLEVLTDFTGFAAGDGLVARTMDGGFTGDVTPFDGDVFRDLDVFDPMNVTAVGNGGLAKQTSDGGDTWGDLDIGTTDDLLGVVYLDADYAFTISNKGGIYSTIDGGATWDERTFEAPSIDFNAVSVALFPSDDGAETLPDVVVFGPGDGGSLGTVTAPLDEIFADGFESGDTSAWSN